MKNERWDIVDALAPAEDFTERQVNPRRHPGGPSPFSAAILFFGCAFALSATVVVPLTEGTSDVISVIHRAPTPAQTRPANSAEATRRSDVDFTRARSRESLARAFDAYFRPPLESESEIEPDGSCFF